MAMRSHAYPGSILMGAQDRLIPYHVPLRFFVAASVFHLAAWVLVIVGYGDIAGYNGGLGPTLGAVHALTLGVLAMTAMGAAYQLLNVATGINTATVWGRIDISRLSFWFYLPGTAVLVAGMAQGAPTVMLWGGGMAAAGFVMFVIVLGRVFLRTESLRPTVRHGWAALCCLLLLSVAGLSLIIDFEYGGLGGDLFPSHTDLALAHALLGVFGFMGLFAFGFSYVLVPMFALASAPDERQASLSFWLMVAGLVGAVLAALSGMTDALGPALAIGGTGVAVHLSLMIRALRDGMKKRLGLSFGLVRAAWGALAISVLIGAIATLLPDADNLPALFWFMALFGWLLTFLSGILQRILPFLASMHAHKLAARAPRVSQMGHQAVTLPVHAACHGLAVVLVAVGIVTDTQGLILAGGVMGGLGAVSFLWFTLTVSVLIISFYAPSSRQQQT